ncbi:MAG: hypothetical protein L0219_00905, partial [Phycisphaerales bacterium]|nr:hypothetical protein [Phycisphaerales bacterium]
GGGGGGKEPVTTFSGRAVVVDVEVAGIRTIISDTGPLPASGGALETSLLTANVPGLLTAEVLHAATVGQGTMANSEASVANLDLTAAGVHISAGLLMSRAKAQCINNAPSVSGSSEIVNLNVNGTPIVASGAPNQTVQLLNVTVIINEQTASISGNTGAITVNALHVIVTDLLNPGNVLAKMVISSAHSDITCNRIVCGGGDFVTGGGWITGTPSGAKGNFGVAGGLKKKGLWGHLVFIDHGSGLKVKGTGVTAYTVINATTRRIQGTAEINGQGGFTYTVEVADNGEPGRNDTFVLSLSNGYNAGGTLGGGNIQLHLPHPCP